MTTVTTIGDAACLQDQTPKVYLLDEPSHFIEELGRELTQYNLQTRHFIDLDSGLSEIRKSPPDLLVLDPKKVGAGDFRIICELKEVNELKSVPFLVNSEDIPEEVLLQSFDFGGDDFLLKPVRIREAVSRIRGLLRRRKMNEMTQGDEQLEIGSLEIDFAHREVRVGERVMKLTATESAILKELAKKPGVVVSRQNLIRSVWPEDNIVEEQNLDVHISSIRKKIEPAPRQIQFIVTVRGVGFRLNFPG